MDNPPKQSKAPFWIGTVWLAFIAALSYYLWGGVMVHRQWLNMWPGVTLEALQGMPRTIANHNGALFGLVPFAAGALLGRSVLARLLGETPVFSACVAIGLPLVSFMLIVLGSAGLFQPAAAAAAVLAAAALGLADLALALVRRRPAMRLAESRPGTGEIVALGFFLLLLFLAAFQPPQFYDALSYHLALPRQYLLAGSTAPLAWHPYSYFPSNGEMLIAGAMAGDGILAPSIFQALLWLSAMLMVRDLAAGLLDRNGGPEASIVAAATLTFAIAAALGTIDVLVLLCSTGAVYFLARAIDTQDAPAASGGKGNSQKGGAPALGLLAAWSIAAGGAAGTKYTAWPAAIVLQGAAALYVALRSDDKKLKFLLAAVLPGAIILMPWPIRNLVYAGNPVMPASPLGLFPGLSEAARETMSRDAHAVDLAFSSLPSVLASPWTMVFDDWNSLATKWGAARFAGPLVWMGFPLYLAAGRKTRPAIIVVLLGVAPLLVSLAMFRMVRFTYPGLGVLAAVAGAGFASWRKHSDRVLGGRAVTSVPLVAVLLLCALLMMRVSGNLTLGYRFARLKGDAVSYFEGRALAEPFESRLAMFQLRANRALPEDAVVLFVGETRSAYLKRRLSAPSYLTPSPLVEALRKGGGESAARSLWEAGFTHVYLSMPELVRLDASRDSIGDDKSLLDKVENFAGGPWCETVLADELGGASICRLRR